MCLRSIGGDGEAYRALLHEYRMSSTTLGEGGFGKVRLATSSRTGHQVAVKIVRRKKLVDRAELLLQREVEYHEKLRHPNIVRLFTWIKTPSRYYLVMEHCDQGDLLAYINSNSLLPMFEIKSLFSQLMHGVRFCHALGFFHRDLKLENLMLCTPQAEEAESPSTRAMLEELEDENFHSYIAPAPGVHLLKIADFGLSTLRPDTNHSATHCGSPLYAAPELMGAGPAPRPDGNYDASKSDLWSCGVILYALLASRLPFDADNIQSLIAAVRTGTPSTPVPAQRGKEAALLVSQLLNVDPAARPCVAQPLPPQRSFSALPLPSAPVRCHFPAALPDGAARSRTASGTPHGHTDGDCHRKNGKRGWPGPKLPNPC
jgi:serine/threonine protein kinase